MTLTLIEKRCLLGDVYSFDFRPSENLVWQAGQSLRLELPVGYGSEEKRFTISSAPFEDSVTFTTRISDSRYKQVMAALEIGAKVRAFGLDGKFLWEDVNTKPILCASGIGITPYRSMLMQRSHDNKPLSATLLYAARSGQFLFKDELDNLSVQNSSLETAYLPDERLSVANIAGKCPDYLSRNIYLVGPEKMVRQLSADLQGAGVNPDRIQIDWFTGRMGWEDL